MSNGCLIRPDHRHRVAAGSDLPRAHEDKPAGRNRISARPVNDQLVVVVAPVDRQKTDRPDFRLSRQGVVVKDFDPSSISNDPEDVGHSVI